MKLALIEEREEKEDYGNKQERKIEGAEMDFSYLEGWVEDDE